MPEQSALVQRTQLGVESTGTPGTAVAAGLRLQTIGLGPPQIHADNEMFRPPGEKYATLGTPGLDWSEWPITGRPSYDEIQYMLCSILGAPVITSPDAVNAPTARMWEWNPSPINEDTRQTYTAEHGNAIRARRAAHLIARAISLNITRERVELGGNAIARAIEDGVTLTANPVTKPVVPITGKQFSFFSDPTHTALGTTRLTRGFSATWGISDAIQAIWPVDDTQSSFAAVVETDPDPTLELTPAADAAGSAFLADLRAQTTRFIRLEARGPIIAAAIRRRLTIDMAVIVRSVGAFSEETGVFVSPYTFEIVNSAAWGRPMRVQLVCEQAAL